MNCADTYEASSISQVFKTENLCIPTAQARILPLRCTVPSFWIEFELALKDLGGQDLGPENL